MQNTDQKVVEGFGDEWSRLPQDKAPKAERQDIFSDYFHVFPWEALPDQAIGVDIGCGSGRWAALVAPKVGHLHALDASPAALEVAARHCQSQSNMTFHHASVGDLPFEDEQLDFAYSLGVLHHVPDTTAALASIAPKLKPGAPFLVYLYYSFDNRPAHYRVIWKASEMIRAIVSRMPHSARYLTSQLLAGFLYWPLAQLCKWGEKLGLSTQNWPLYYYRDKSFYMMRTDALDRFGTRLEKRFSRIQIQTMLEQAGFCDIQFSDRAPYWCALARRAPKTAKAEK